MLRYNLVKNFRPIDLHNKKSQTLIIHCADPRFQAAYRQVIDGLGRYYDLYVSAGASKAVVEDPSAMANIKLLEGLHHFEEIHILDHIDCGAFGPVDNEKTAHQAMLGRAAETIRKELPQLKVLPHLLGEDSEIEI